MTQETHRKQDEQEQRGLSRRAFLKLSSTAGGTVLIGLAPGVTRVLAQDGADVTPTLDEITVLAGSPFPPPTPRENNTYWQEIESRLGVTINFQLVPRADYDALLGTTLASGDLPDMISGDVRNPIIRQAFLDGAFVRLGEFGLPQDTRDLPGLPTIQPSAWVNSSLNGIVAGVPTGAQDYQAGHFYRSDWLETLGIDQPTTLDELTALMEAFVNDDPDGNGNANTFGFSLGNARHADGGGWRAFTDPFGIPNNWQVLDDGTLEHKDVSEATRASTEHMAMLVGMGLFNPDFLTLNSTQANEEFASGITGGLVHNLASGYDLWGARVRDLIEGADVVQIDPVSAEGYTASTWMRPGYNTATQIRFDYADDEARLWDLLRVMDFWFDPETEEFVNFGFEGEHHTVGEDGALTQTEQGSADIAWIRAWSPRHVLQYVDAPYVRPATREQIIIDTERLKQIAVDDPTWGIFPDLGFEDPSTTLEEFANNTIGRMVTGERSLDEWDSYVEEWYNRGGQLLTDTMTSLYQQYKA
jgi:putative aldouronate transport system substrate-binding protein